MLVCFKLVFRVRPLEGIENSIDLSAAWNLIPDSQLPALITNRLLTSFSNNDKLVYTKSSVVVMLNTVVFL